LSNGTSAGAFGNINGAVIAVSKNGTILMLEDASS
jgi:hypothetical protein